MPRSRIPSLWPSIQIFLRAGTASLEVSLISMLILLSTRGANYPWTYAATFFGLALDIAEIVGLASVSRKIPRFGPWMGFFESFTVGFYIPGFLSVLMEKDPGYSDEYMAKRSPWTTYIMFFSIASWALHLLFSVFVCVDYCYVSRRRRRRRDRNSASELRESRQVVYAR